MFQLETKSKLVIKESNCTILPLGELEECEENRRFESVTVPSTLKKYAHVCSCQMKRIMRHHTPVTRGKPAEPFITQEDFDTLRFGIVATVVDGKYQDIASVIVQCSECEKLTFYGKLPTVLNMFGIGAEDYYAGNAIQVTEPHVVPAKPDDMELEDLDTGEVSPVTGQLKELLGGKTAPGKPQDSPSSSPTMELNRS